MRAFLAIELPKDIRDSLAAAVARLRKTIHTAASWTREENLHITLRFLGEVSEEALEQISADVAAAAADTPSCALRVEGLGVFPNSRKARVLWCGCSGEVEPLAALQQRCETAAVLSGLPGETRRWAPHATLARFRRSPPEPALRQALAAFTSFSAGEFSVEGVTLFSSALTPRSAIHNPIRKFRFSCQSTSPNEPFTTC